MADVTITIPATIALDIPSVGSAAPEPWTFVRFVDYMIDGIPELGIPGHPLFNQSGVGIRAAARIQTALKGAEPDASVKLDPKHGAADKKLLRDAIDAPIAGLVPPLKRIMPDGKTSFDVMVPGKMLAPYLDAVSDEATKG